MNDNLYSDFFKYWQIDPDFLFLNHGSFGACPKSVISRQQFFQQQMEKQPLKFMTRDLPDLLAISKNKLAGFLGCDTKNIVFIRNATTGVNTVLRSLPFSQGDEIIISNHIYPACRNTISFIADQKGVVVREAVIPFPIENKSIVLNRLLEQINPKTKLLLIDHITSPTGLLFPVEEIVFEFNNRGIDTLIDGAHAPGTTELNLEKLNTTFYTGNCHKWLCSPKGSAFLYVRPDKQELIHPLTISLTEGKGKSFEERFYWTGTEDPSPYLCIGFAIDELNSLFIGGWKGIMKHNHDLAVEGRKILCNALQTDIPCPESMIANLASIPISDTKDQPSISFNHFDSLQETLFYKYQTELFVTYWPAHPQRLIRISPQLYNSLKQYVLLGQIIKHLHELFN